MKEVKKFQVSHSLAEAQISEANINECFFRPDDGWPICVGYCIGPDDGKSTAYVTPDDAYNAWFASQNTINSKNK